MTYAACHVLLPRPVDLTTGELEAAWNAREPDWRCAVTGRGARCGSTCRGRRPACSSGGRRWSTTSAPRTARTPRCSPPTAPTLVHGDVWAEATLARDWTARLWVDVVVSRAGPRRHSAYTVGLGALGRREVEVTRSRLPADRLRARLREVADVVLNRGTLDDGETIGSGPLLPFTVRHAPSAFGRPGTVYLVDPGA